MTAATHPTSQPGWRGLRVVVLASTLGMASLLGLATAAWAGIPEAYGAMVLGGGERADRAEFDLRPALAHARQAHKRLYLYLGARDCPYCRKYEAFLARHADTLVPLFAAHNYLVVDLRSALLYQADRLFFRTSDGAPLAYRDYMAALGDERARMLVYPSVWLLDEAGRALMQMPAGTGTFETVPEQLEILELVQ